MKILLISSLYGISGGGAGILVYHLSRALSDSGNEVSVITMGNTSSIVEMNEKGIHIYKFRPKNIYAFEDKEKYPAWQKMIWQLLDIYNFHSARVLRQLVAKESPDIIHIHKMRGFSSAVWLVAPAAFPEKVIQTCHDYESMSPDGILRGTVGKMALRKQWPVRGYQILRANFSKNVSVVTAPNAFTLNRIKNSGVFPQARSQVIANTHGWSNEDLKAIHQRINPVVGKDVQFLYLGRLEPEKGITQLCDAFIKIYNHCPSAYLSIAGWGTLEDELLAKYSRYPRINFLGVVDGVAKEMALAKSTVVILPSLVDEVFPLVVAEAFAFGKPVIASRVGGLPELVRPGETGWLVAPGDIDVLAERLLSVAEIDQGLLEKMSQNCKEYSYQFAVERVLSEYLEIYGQLKK